MIKVTQKQTIVICFVMVIIISLSYFLYQIDKHERALLGQEWLNPVPRDVWQKYLSDKQEYDKKIENYVADNQDVINLIRTFRQTDPLQKSNSNTYLSSDRSTLTTPFTMVLSKEHLNNFKTFYPNEFKRWLDINFDTATSSPKEPKPSNPSKPVIQQGISSLYRYLFAIEGVLILSLLLFIYMYKEQMGNEHNSSASGQVLTSDNEDSGEKKQEPTNQLDRYKAMLNAPIGRLYFSMAFVALVAIHITLIITIPKTSSESLYLIEWLMYMSVLSWLSSRRFRDLGISPWKFLCLFIPVYNLYILSQLVFKKGNQTNTISS